MQYYRTQLSFRTLLALDIGNIYKIFTNQLIAIKYTQSDLKFIYSFRARFKKTRFGRSKASQYHKFDIGVREQDAFKG